MENKEHKCKYCGVMTSQPDEECYKSPNTKAMENKTAVQIFFEDLCHLGYIEYPDESLVQDRLNLALELEKQQIIDTFETAFIEAYKLPLDRDFNTAGHYYSQTYKKPTE
jgi:hypothetical protein